MQLLRLYFLVVKSNYHWTSVYIILQLQVVQKYRDFNFPSYYVWGTLAIVQIFDFRFLVDLHVLGSGESKKHKNSMVSGCSLVS